MSYIVKAGDTLSGIYGANWKTLSGYTGDPSKLAVGTVLPDPTGSPTPVPTATPTAQPIPTATPQPTRDPHINPATGIWDDNYFNSQNRSNAVTMPNNVPSIDLNKLYESSKSDPAVVKAQADMTAAQSEIDARTQAYNAESAKINNNPFYSEATRLGKQRSLDEAYQKDVTLSQTKLATATNAYGMASSDAQNKVNIALKQYDINRQSYQDNLTRFDTLLKNGALNNASVQDIADMALSTGFTTSQVQNIVAQTKKNDVKPQLINSTDDAGNVTIAVVDLNTGKVISQNSLGRIDKSKASGSGSVYGTQSDKYLDEALKILGEGDIAEQSARAKTSGQKKLITGDKALSMGEYTAAYKQILGLVGDQKLAGEVFDRAFSAGGYTTSGFSL